MWMQVLGKIFSDIGQRLQDCTLEDWGIDSATDFAHASPEVRPARMHPFPLSPGIHPCLQETEC